MSKPQAANQLNTTRRAINGTIEERGDLYDL